MANTDRYRELVKRIDELREHLLPQEFSKTGEYTNQVLEIARGYKLLVHAEIEAYIEDAAVTIIRAALRVWKRKRKESATLISFLCCYHCSWNTDNEESIRSLALARKRIKDKTEEILDNASIQYLNIIKDNHGIRENNLRKIICPTGIELDDLDTTWLSLLDSFGQQRGEVAHNTKKATAQINPQDELKNVEDIMAGIRRLDQLFRKTLKGLEN